ncbi:unnamed protein product, partial [Ectocarpus sp. 13 AM-2016]
MSSAAASPRQTSKLWVRVCYRGREDGWVLTANKRGPTLVPSEDQASAAGEFDAQEAAFAASNGGQRGSAVDWRREGRVGTAERVPAGRRRWTCSPWRRRRRSPSRRGALWVRVCYRGREDGWVLTANKRGPTLVPSEDQASAAGKFDAQEAAFAASIDGFVPEDPADRPLTGAKPPPAAPAAASGSVAGDGDDRSLTGGGKGAWVPLSEFPPGEEDGPVRSGDGGDALVKKASAGGVVDAAGQGKNSAGDGAVSSEYMTALGFVKVREEADPFSMDLGSVKKGNIVKVMETFKLWVRVCYRGREDGWVLTANKRGPTLVPSEDQASAAGEFDAQEAAFAANSGGALPEDPSDRPLTGAKPPPDAATAATGDSEDRPLTGGGKGAWVPPSEFPPGEEDGPVSSGSCVVGDEAFSVKQSAGEGVDAGGQADGSAAGAPISREYLTALGFVKVREEADPFSMDLGSVKKGDIVKVLETSKLWVRVCYRGRDDGWVLTANKRGPTLVPSEDQDSAVVEFDAQEAAFASSSGGTLPEDPSDRPLTGAKPKPPPAAPTAATGDSEDRPLTGGGKGAWVPPSEFPPGQEDGPVSYGGGGGSTGGVTPGPEDERPLRAAQKAEGGEGAASGGAMSEGDEVPVEYMKALGVIKLREEADPFSMDLGVVQKEHVVKVLEMKDLWARVAYRGKTDGWVLTENKRGKMLTAAEDREEAEAAWAEQEQNASQDDGNGNVPPASRDDRPIGGKRSTQHDGSDPGADNGGLETTGAASSPSGNGGGGVLDTSSQAAVGTDGGPAEPPAGGLKPWHRRRKVASSRTPAAEQGGADQAEAAAAAPPAKPWQRRGATKSDPLADGTDEAVPAAAPAKPWQRKKTGALLKDSTAEVGGSAVDETGDSTAAAEEATAPAKPWLKKKRPGGGVRAGAVDDGSSSDKPGGDDAVVAKPWEAATRAASETVEEAAVAPEGVEREAGEGDHSTGGEDGLAGLKACLEERDWKKRVAEFEAASRACRSRVEGAAGTVGPLLPRMLQDKNVQAVDSAVDTLTAYLSLRSNMGAEEGSSLASALAERALCCGRAPVEAKADAAAATLLAAGGGSGGLARRGAWLTLAARAGGLENEFFPPAGDEGGRGRSKVAAAAPKAVSGCVRAMSAGIGKGRTVVAGGGDSRKEVYSAAKAMLRSSKLPVKMAGISLSGALYAAEGDVARDDLGVEDMEARIKSQLERAFADADAAAVSAAGSGNTSPIAEKPLAVPASPPIRPPATPTPGGGGDSGAIDLLSDDDGNLELLTPPPLVSRVPERRSAEPRGGGGGGGGVDTVDQGVAPLGGNKPAEAAKSGTPDSTVDDELWSEDDEDEDGRGAGLEGDDHYTDAEAAAAAAAGGTAVKIRGVNDKEEDDLLDGLSADLPDLRITTSPPEDDGSRAAPPGGAGEVGRAKPRLGLAEKMSSERDLGAAAGAAAETPRRLSTPGYWESAKKRGVRTTVERDTQFLGTQMLVLPEGERSAWDDILDDMLLKAPPADPLRWSQHRLSADGAPGIVGPGGGSAPHSARPHEEDALKLMPPPPPAISSSLPSGASSSASSALLRPDSLRSVDDDDGAGSGRGSLGFEVGSDSEDRRRMSWKEERRRQPPPPPPEAAPLSLPESLPASFGRGEEDATVGTAAESRPSWNEQQQQQQRQEMLAVRSSADESVRERMARFSARRRQARQAPTPRTGEEPLQEAPADGATDDGEGGAAANVVATAGRRHLLRGPGSWTSGIGSGSGPGGVRSPRLSRAGHGGGGGSGSGSLGSPSSSSNLVVTQEALGNLNNNLASLMSVKRQASTSENRESRRQSISRRLSRGTSLGTFRATAVATEAAELGAAEEAEAVALGASPAAARAAAEAAAAETIAARRRALEARRASRRSRGGDAPGGSAAALREFQDESVIDVSPAARGGGDGGGGGGGGRLGSILPADTVLESEDESYATPRGGRGSSESVASSSSAGGRWGRAGESAAAAAAGHETSRGRGGPGFFGQQGSDPYRRKERYSTISTPNDTPADTPVDSPRSGSDSDAAYDSLRGVLGKVSLSKYFKEFRRREVRLEDLQHLTEGDLTEMGMPVGPRKRLLVEVHGVATPVRTPVAGAPMPPPPPYHVAAALVPPAVSPSSPPPPPPQAKQQEPPLKAAVRSPRQSYPGGARTAMFSPPKRAGSLGGGEAASAAAAAAGPPAAEVTSRRSVPLATSAASLRARLKGEENQKALPGRKSVSPRPSLGSTRARASSEGMAAAAAVSGTDENGLEGDGAGHQASPTRRQKAVSPRRASSFAPSAGGGDRRDDHRATIGGSGLAAKRAK